MRILHIVHQYPPEHLGGTELYTQSLARRQAAAGHIPSIFVPALESDPGPEPSIEQGVRVYRRRVGSAGRPAVFLRTFWSRAASSHLERILEEERPDVVHIQHLMGLPGKLAQILTRRQIPYALTLHDYWYLCANAQLLTNYDQTICAGPDLFVNCARCFQARAGVRDLAVSNRSLAPLLARRNRLLAGVLESAAAIIAPSAFVRDETARLGAPSQHMVVVRHGIQLPAEMPARSLPPEGALRVVYLGGIAWQKGIHVLLEAANDLPAGVEVTIYGDLAAQPDYSSALRQQVRRPGVTLAGRLEREEIWPALAAADVVVIPALWYETSSLIAAEAQAAGAVVVASNLGALPERVTDGLDGFLFPAGDAAALRQLLLDLHASPKRLRELQAKIRPVRRIEDHVLEIEALYRSIIRDQISP